MQNNENSGFDRLMVEGLATLLDVQPRGEAHFLGRRKPGGIGRVYGGQVVAQALMAATKTVRDDRAVHSLHAYFLRGGSEDHEIDYRVESDFDGGSFSNRRVIASQQGRPIFHLAASFHRSGPGLEHAAAMPDVPPPEQLETMRDHALRLEGKIDPAVYRIHLAPSPFDLRPVGEPPFCRVEPYDGPVAFWFRTLHPFEHAQSMHRAVVAFVSDLSLLSAAIVRHGEQRDLDRASIDHAVWFHGDMAVDDWLLYTTESPWAGEGRGLGRGQIFDRSGRLVASTAQEGMMRPRREKD